MFYYKVLDNNDNLIDIVNSYDLRYWHKGRIFSCLFIIFRNVCSYCQPDGQV